MLKYGPGECKMIALGLPHFQAVQTFAQWYVDTAKEPSPKGGKQPITPPYNDSELIAELKKKVKLQMVGGLGIVW